MCPDIEQEDFQYFMFEMKRYHFPGDLIDLSRCKAGFTNGDLLSMLTIKNITSIIKQQQLISDEMYQDAIEANYSHEQMTPLNCILGTTQIIINRLVKLHLLNK